MEGPSDKKKSIYYYLLSAMVA